MSAITQPSICQPRPAAIALVTHLEGNVGKFVDSDVVTNQRVTVEVTGTIDAGWLTCFLPLIKPVGFEATLQVRVSSAGCRGDGTFQIRHTASFKGIKSCLSVRTAMAHSLRGTLEEMSLALER